MVVTGTLGSGRRESKTRFVGVGGFLPEQVPDGRSVRFAKLALRRSLGKRNPGFARQNS